MKYKITPFNVIAVALTLFAFIDYLRTKDPTGLGLLAVIYVLGGVVGVLLVDFLIQWLAKEYKKIIPIEMLMLGVVVFWIASMERTKTWLIPENFGEGYVTVIYDMEGAEKLPIHSFTWSYEIKIPESGILLTSTKFEDDLPKTDIKTYTGAVLDEYKEEFFECLFESEMNCSNKNYKYKTWIVQKKKCEYASVKADSVRKIMQSKFCK
ncbi:MAG: hypothetical protein MUE81_10485 [Thermoflexibacter sp.]|jgi:hypothetical protein|nr:hypothetical protein [Thermoflexibacter sp.]